MTRYEMYEIILAVIQEAEDLGLDVSYESELRSLKNGQKDLVFYTNLIIVPYVANHTHKNTKYFMVEKIGNFQKN